MTISTVKTTLCKACFHLSAICIFILLNGYVSTLSAQTYTDAAGGWNGGGNGMDAYDGYPFQYMGGGGGGATDIRIGGTSLADRILVAGGGGGGGYDCGSADFGGEGGTTTGGDGGHCGATYGIGTGGTQVAGGMAVPYSGWNNADGGISGAGGNAAVFTAGGGGGGGYYGGGGGSWGGGGGGSSYASSLCTAVTMNAGINTGNGKAVISATGFAIQTFYFTGSVQDYIVPAGINLLTVELFGASGGGGSMIASPLYNEPDGGYGAQASATIPVSPGDLLHIYIGQQGENGGQFTGCTLTATVDTLIPVNCAGDSSGSATVLASGGILPYSYAWSSGSTDSIANNLSAGNYSCVITDANGCTYTVNVIINEPSPLSVISSSTNVTCFASSNGTASVAASGGIMPYNYTWNTNSTATGISALSAGNYSCLINDANGCSTTRNFTILQPDSIAAAITTTQVKCAGSSDGSANITVNGGTAPYSIVWSDGYTGTSDSGLIAGSYMVTVSDSNGCALTQIFSVASPDPVTILLSTVDAQCAQADGSVSAVLSGGTGSIHLLWNTGDSLLSLNGIIAGSYSAYATDSNGCTADASVTVNSVNAPVAVATITNVNCYGNSDGSVSLSISGGTGPVSVNWMNLNTTGLSLSSLAAGQYVFILTDSMNCSVTDTVSISQPDSMVLTATVTPETGGYDGAVDLSVSGGSPGYFYNWSDGSMTEDLTGIPSGNYYVTVTDQHNCIQLLTVNVGTATGLNEETAKQDNLVIYPNPNDGSFKIRGIIPAPILITDGTGRVVFQLQKDAAVTHQKIITRLKPGLYYLDQKTGSKANKLIIE